jgi:hypothetical protein
MRVRLHRLSSGLIKVEDEAQVERAASVLVALEFGNGSLRSLNRVEPNNARTTGATARLVLYFRLLNFADCSEQFYKVVVAGRPR